MNAVHLNQVYKPECCNHRSVALKQDIECPDEDDWTNIDWAKRKITYAPINLDPYQLKQLLANSCQLSA